MEKATWQRELPSQRGGGEQKKLQPGSEQPWGCGTMLSIPSHPSPSHPIPLGTSPSPPSPVGMLEAPQRS